MLNRLRGRIVMPEGVFPGVVQFGDRIERLELTPGTGPYLLPGFIDTHVHGGGGGDAMDGPEGVRALAAFHLRHGTTTVYPTTITNPWSHILDALHGIAMVHAEGDPGLPDLPGAHLEGPFISPERLGAQPPYALKPTDERLAELFELGVVRLVTLAPEVPGALEAARQFVGAGVRVSFGHSRGSYDAVTTLAQAVRSAGGTVGFTHLYNAMGGLGGRAPGLVGAALADAESHAELILDFHHVHPGAVRVALAAKPDKVHLVTDAIRATGLPEGETELGGQRVFVKNGVARLEDGTLAGSVLTLDRALNNALELGLTVPQASALLSAVPARYLGLHDRGVLYPGRRADLVVMNEEFDVLEVYVKGRRVYG